MCHNEIPQYEFIGLAGHALEVPETDDVGVLGVYGRESGQEGGGLADGALPFVVRQKLERLALRFGHPLQKIVTALFKRRHGI